LTSNQINWAKVQEDQRSHLRSEELTAESNAIAKENARINQLNADVNARNADTNAANARTNAFNAQINAQNAETNRMRADIDSRNADTNLLNASTRQAELALAQQELQERMRSNMRNEEIKAQQVANDMFLGIENMGIARTKADTERDRLEMEKLNSKAQRARNYAGTVSDSVQTLFRVGGAIAGLVGLH